MITQDNFKDLLLYLDFTNENNVYSKHFLQGDFYLKADFDAQKLVYPPDLKILGEFTGGFTQNESFVVFECVHRLLAKGYKPEHIELEPKWTLGHGAGGGRADILVRNQQLDAFLIIECKTADKEFKKAWRNTKKDGAQLFSYVEVEKRTEFVCLYASDFIKGKNDIPDTLTVEQEIIALKDNPKTLALYSNADKNKDSKDKNKTDKVKVNAFADAMSQKERFDVWKRIYNLESTQTGIFEDNVQAYQIGKDKYTLADDTQILNSIDKKGKYHEFRTILRAYNVSRRENAFEILVNLFLCKIVDEIENPTDLKFYWKGAANDNYEDFIDRLQELYKIGMKKYLKQDITYFSNTEIDNLFWVVKSNKNKTKEEVKKIFKALKFFKGLDFDFIKVQNEEQFNKNAKIVVRVVQMWQNIRLQTNGQNQFLGDMFEYFLDNGVKQSEGQFFTPIPICKFIVSALPLDAQLQHKSEPLRAIDYASGSGHFLTEYAQQITPLIAKHKQTDVVEYYQNIFGIEKEDRLALVAQVSTFMHGYKGIKIIEKDALAQNDEAKQADFDVLIANPPFAVEGFLTTLLQDEDEDEFKERFDLYAKVNDNNNKNIQCFFLERAKQLLAPNGVTGIIVPSSVLSNSDSIHIHTREILLKHFDIISIAELGSNTFGKTGTNTVVLFMRRKAHRPTQAEHFADRVESYFTDTDEVEKYGGIYQDLDMIKQYAAHINIPFDDYKTIIIGKPSDALLTTEMFTDYINDFENSTDTQNLITRHNKQILDLPKNILTELTKLQKENKTAHTLAELKKQSADLLPQRTADLKAKQAAEIQKRKIKHLQEIEQDKLYYYILAAHNPTKVLLIKSPTDNKEQKQFLGYEWSNSKGNEGIRYTGGDTIHDIQTPMFDPNDRNNTDKINYFVQQNFQHNTLPIPNNLENIMAYTSLVDLLDFSRKDFNKTLSLSEKKKPQADIFTNSKIVRLGDVCDILIGGTPSRAIQHYFTGKNLWVSIAEMNGQIITNTKEKITDEGVQKSNVKIIPKGTTLLSFKLSIGKTAIAGANLYTNEAIAGLIPKDNTIISNTYLFQLFTAKVIDLSTSNNAIGQSLNSKYLREELQIPLPPLPIQQQIVTACQAIDDAVSKAHLQIEDGKREIEEIILSITNDIKRMGNIAKRINDNIDPQTQKGEVNYIGLENIESNTGRLVGTIKTAYQTIKSVKTVFKKGDILYGKLRPNLNKVYMTEQDGICSTDILVFRFENENLALFYKHYLMLPIFNNEVLKTVSGQQLPRTSWTDIKELKIPVPSLAEQTALVAAIEIIETNIAAAQQTINAAAAQKAAVMTQYL